ncbi:MAG: hypothetical protein KBF37_00150 [Saprospiraceae bacterium]|jgi:hypothetical protein|nr:hypothetical protein [Saprospiraceae bacterium]MBP9208704.1 hypothetical protein [Saprospiraceae bacterium]MBV6472262.1 hypothetical protein [Saprospiraceae bacterium]
MKSLIKVASEFNVGLQTIIDILTANGFDVEARPRSSVTAEMYDCLVAELSPVSKSTLSQDVELDRLEERLGANVLASLKQAGCSTARQVLELSVEELVVKTKLEERMVLDVLRILEEEIKV